MQMFIFNVEQIICITFAINWISFKIWVFSWISDRSVQFFFKLNIYKDKIKIQQKFTMFYRKFIYFLIIKILVFL